MPEPCSEAQAGLGPLVPDPPPSKICFPPLSRRRGLRQVSMPLTRVQRGPWNPMFLKVPLPTLATALPMPPLAPLLTNLITPFIPSDASHPAGPRSHPSSPLPSNPHLLHIGWLPGVAAPPSSEKLLFCGKELISHSLVALLRPSRTLPCTSGGWHLSQPVVTGPG